MFKELRDQNELLLDAIQLMKVAGEEHYTRKAKIIVESFLNKQDFTEELMKHNLAESPDKQDLEEKSRRDSISSHDSLQHVPVESNVQESNELPPVYQQ